MKNLQAHLMSEGNGLARFVYLHKLREGGDGCEDEGETTQGEDGEASEEVGNINTDVYKKVKGVKLREVKRYTTQGEDGEGDED